MDVGPASSELYVLSNLTRSPRVSFIKRGGEWSDDRREEMKRMLNHVPPLFPLGGVYVVCTRLRSWLEIWYISFFLVGFPYKDVNRISSQDLNLVHTTYTPPRVSFIKRGGEWSDDRREEMAEMDVGPASSELYVLSNLTRSTRNVKSNNGESARIILT
jgi:hypothetical protein